MAIFDASIGLFIANGGDDSQRHVTACERPLIILLQRQRKDERLNDCHGEERTDEIRTTLDLFVQALKQVGRVGPWPASLLESLCRPARLLQRLASFKRAWDCPADRPQSAWFNVLSSILARLAQKPF